MINVVSGLGKMFCVSSYMFFFPSYIATIL